MSVEMQVTYEGGLRCRAVHVPSGSEIFTDAPVDNHGRGELFSPTDLVGAALASCMLTVMGIVAEQAGIDISGTKVALRKEMASKPNRRIGEITMVVEFPAGKTYTEKDMARLKRAAEICPVKGSLSPDVKVAVEFKNADGAVQQGG